MVYMYRTHWYALASYYMGGILIPWFSPNLQLQPVNKRLSQHFVFFCHLIASCTNIRICIPAFSKGCCQTGDSLASLPSPITHFMILEFTGIFLVLLGHITFASALLVEFRRVKGPLLAFSFAFPLLKVAKGSQDLLALLAESWKRQKRIGKHALLSPT